MFFNLFEECLWVYDEDKKFIFEKEVVDIIVINVEYLIGVFFDLGEERFNDFEEGILYEFFINVVYDVIEGGFDVRGVVE